MQKLVSRMVRLFMVFAAACCIMAGAGGAMSVKAAQTSQVTEAQAADTEDTAQDERCNASAGRYAYYNSGCRNYCCSNCCSSSTGGS